MTRGRPPSVLITTNFTKGRSVGNNSHRHYYICKHCDNEREIEHRDNNLLDHLANRRACPNAPNDQYTAALRQLAGKRVQGARYRNPSTDELESAGAGEENVEREAVPNPAAMSEEAMGGEGQVQVARVKKRKTGPLDMFVDQPMTDAMQTEANRRWFRYEFIVYSRLRY